MWFHTKVPTVIRHRFTSPRVTTLSTTLLLMLISCYVTHMATSLEILTGSAADGSGRVVPAHQPLGEKWPCCFLPVAKGWRRCCFRSPWLHPGGSFSSTVGLPSSGLPTFNTPLPCQAAWVSCQSLCMCVFQAVTQHVSWCDICNNVCGRGCVCGQKMFRITCLLWKRHLQF